MKAEMEKLLAQFLGDIADGISREGLRFFRIKALSASLKVARTIRKLFLIQLGLILICFVWAMSFFSSALLIIASSEPLGFDEGMNRAACFSLGTFAISTLLIWMIGREKTWLNVLGLQKQIEPAPSARRNDGIDYGELERIVERVVSQKLNQDRRSEVHASV